MTHTAVGALVAGLVVGLATVAWGRPATLVVMGFAAWLLAHAALSSSTRAKVGDWLIPGRARSWGRFAFRSCALIGAVLAGLIGAAMVNGSVPRPGWLWLGVAVAWGCLAHTLGDALTYSRVPLLWPLRVRGCRWARVGAPEWMRFRTGSRTEKAVVVLMAVVGVAALGVLGASS